MHISASRIEPNFTTGLGPIHVLVSKSKHSLKKTVFNND